MMKTFEITNVLDVGDDVLLVRFVDADGNELEARGWVSATTNHYDADAYFEEGATVPQGGVDEDNQPLPDRDVGGQRKPDAKPRAMTPAEVGEYAHALVLEQHPELADAPLQAAPAPIEFVPPAP